MCTHANTEPPVPPCSPPAAQAQGNRERSGQAGAASRAPLQPHCPRLVTASGTQLPGATAPGSGAAEQTPPHGSQLQKAREEITVRENMTCVRVFWLFSLFPLQLTRSGDKHNPYSTPANKSICRCMFSSVRAVRGRGTCHRDNLYFH